MSRCLPLLMLVGARAKDGSEHTARIPAVTSRIFADPTTVLGDPGNQMHVERWQFDV
jgi:hypothetical protein